MLPVCTLDFLSWNKKVKVKEPLGGHHLIDPQWGVGWGLGVQRCSAAANPCPWCRSLVASVEWHGTRTPSLPILEVDQPTHGTPCSSANRAGYVANNTNYCYMLATRYTGSNGILGG